MDLVKKLQLIKCKNFHEKIAMDFLKITNFVTKNYERNLFYAFSQR